MDNFTVDVKLSDVVHQFEVAELPHHNHEACKFRAFKDGKMVASFEPDDHHFLHVCQNPGHLPEDILHLLAEEIEAHHPHEFIQQEKFKDHEESISKK